jgi:predicted  nucleic acid-binding Zn-ribbon protein
LLNIPENATMLTSLLARVIHSRFMNQLEKELRTRNDAVKSLAGDMRSLEEERAILQGQIAGAEK